MVVKITFDESIGVPNQNKGAYIHLEILRMYDATAMCYDHL